ncbi:lamin tail domain-containing protein [Flavobacteriales bacterium]|nr:lamin tail domain-containing protein [Flavobacteriales bacterium]
MFENNQSISIQSFNGSLNVFETTTIDFGNLTIEEGAIDILITTPNDVNDSDNLLTEYYNIENYNKQTLEEVTVKLLTDDYAAETYMEITDENGLLIWSEGNENVGTTYNTFDGSNTPIDYTNPLENNQNYEWLVTLPATGCLKFTIYDYYGDGLNAAQWSGTDGNWSIEDHNNTLMEEQSLQNFGGFDEAFFTNYLSPNCSDLFFSEYVEGSLNNRALEIYNPTSNTIDLSNYSIERYPNGSSLATENMSLEGYLLPGQTWIITNSDTDTTNQFGYIEIELYNMADQTAPTYPSPLYFNGNDALTLSKNGVVIDVFGKIGEDPGNGWYDFTDANDGQLWTQNSTLVRKSNILSGNPLNPSSFNPSEQWTLFPNNTFSNLGFHQCDCNNNFSKTYIPDDNFEQYLIEIGYDDILDDSVLTINISDITSLNVSSREISDLTGMQAMPNLTFLASDNNNLSEINVSQNINLQTLWIGGNNLTEIDITQNTALSSFVIWGNELTELDLNQNDSLTYLDCSNNNITEIDVTQNINLTNLYVWNNEITEIDVAQNINLESLSITGNELTEINVTQNVNLQTFYIGENNLTEIDVTQNTNLYDFRVWENNLTEIDVTQNTELAYLDLGKNNLTELDVTLNTYLLDLIVYNNSLTTLDLSQNINLQTLTSKFNYLNELDVSNCPNLNSLSCRFNNINELDISQNIFLQELWLNGGNTNLFCITTHDTAWANNQPFFLLTDDKFFSEDCSQENIIASCFDETASNYDDTEYDETIYTLVNQGCFNGLTYIPDDAFEQYLINLGFDDVMDNYMSTYTAQNITQLYFSNLNIYDLTGIQDFEILQVISANSLPIDSINLSSNANLTYVGINNSSIEYLNIQNGNNTNLNLESDDNNALNCILVDDVEYASSVWTVENNNIDSWSSFSELSFDYTLTISEASDTESCDGIAIIDVAESLSSYNYSWNGSPSSSFSYLCGGNNTFEISDPNGQCSQTVTIFVGPYINGCMDVVACNYNQLANQQDNSCLYPITYYDCDFNCISDSDFDGICDQLEVFGCTSNSSPNYDPLATEDDGSCIECYLDLEYIISYPTNSTSCDGIIGVIVNNSEYDFSIYVNDVELSSNYNFNSCYGNNTIYVVDEQGCSVSEVLFLTAESIDGCTDPTALNFNSEATSDDGSCIYSNQDACDFTPEGLYVNNIIHNRISFNWSLPSVSPSHYMIRYRPVGASQWSVITAGPETPVAYNGTSRTRFFMEPSTTYEWSIRSRLLNGDGTTNCQSPWSTNSQYTTLPACANLENLSVSTEANWVTFFADAPDASWGVWQSKGKMREIGTNAYRYVNGNSNGDINGLKGNFTASTDYEWHTKAWCTGNLNQNGAPDPMYHSGWGDFSPFSTEDPCDKMPTNLTTSSNGANTAVIMSWDTPESGAPDHYFLELTNTTTGQQFQWNNIPGIATSKAKYNQNTGDVFAWKIRGACGTNGTSWATSFSETEYYILGGARLENEELTKVELSPNPSRGIFNVRFEVPRNNTIDITISNYLGKVVYSEQFNPQEDVFEKSIDISSNANGIYLLTIKTNTGLINKRVVIQ